LRQYTASPGRIVNGGVEMYVNSKWISVNDEAIQYLTLEGVDGKTKGGHSCGAQLDHDMFVIFCAVLPPRPFDVRALTAEEVWREPPSSTIQNRRRIPPPERFSATV
jgi:hypothetical protein